MLSRIILAGQGFRRLITVNTASLSTSSTALTTKNHYDIVIVGGGMVGGTLASALGEI